MGKKGMSKEEKLSTILSIYQNKKQPFNLKEIEKEKVVVQETDLGIQYLVSKKGSGPYPNPGDFVVINYTGLLSDEHSV